MNSRFLLVALFWAVPLTAQVADTTPPRLTIRGVIGSDGEVYRMAGRDARRPPESGRLYLTPSLTYGSLTVTGNLLLSTEESSRLGLGGLPGRQRINQFGVHPRWDWGKADIGSFAESWSSLSWSGVRVDGLGLELSPGSWRVGAFTGRARQAVFGGATSGSFARTIRGVRAGAGRRPEFGEAGRYVDVVFLRAADDPGSLPVLSDTTPVPYLPDSLAVQPDTALLPAVPINPYAVTPHENAVVATSMGTSFFRGVLSWTGELAGSIHSRDRRATALTDDQAAALPGWLRSLVTPRVGTHADVAYTSRLALRVARLPGATTRSPRSLTASLGLQSIGPGYVSLATPYLPNDLRGIDGRATLRVQRWTVQVDGLVQRDNLAGQKLATTHRSRASFFLTGQPVPGWQASVRTTTVGMVRDIADSLGSVDYAARVFSTTQAWIPRTGGFIRSLAASYTRQVTGDAGALHAAGRVSAHTSDLRVALPVGSAVTVTPTLGVTMSRVGDGASTTRATYGLIGDWRDPGRRWLAAASLNRSQLGRTLALTSRLSVRFSATPVDVVTLVVRTSRYRGLASSTLDFEEHVVSLRWGRRF